MAKLTARERAALPKKLFGIPEKSPGPGSYPMEDQAHARAALSRASANATPADKKRIREKVHRLYPKIGMDPSQMRPLSNMC